MSRVLNPYKNINWENVQRLCTCTHMHCVNDEQFQSFIKQGLEFVILANYHPSVPWYPLKEMRENSLRIGQNGVFKDGKYIDEYVDFTPYTKEDKNLGNLVFSNIPSYLLEAPNAEHHWFSNYNVYLHISAPGSSLSTGYPDVPWFKNQAPLCDLSKFGFQKGCPITWQEGFKLLLDKLITPDGGGIIINHPTWSHLPFQDILDMLDFDDRVLGIEIYNDGCAYDYTDVSDHLWDMILSTGRQCFGFCVQDHPNNVWQGRTYLLTKERTSHDALRAMRNGQFFGSITGEHYFTKISFDGKKLDISLDSPCDEFQLISKKGIIYFDNKIKEYSCEFTQEELAEHLYFRCTARYGRRQEKLYSQPIMLTDI